MKNPGFLRHILFVLSAVSVYGQLSDAQQKEFASQYRSAMHFDATCAKILSGGVDQKRLAVIRAVLGPTQEVFIHQQRGASKNRVYLSPDGHKEAVYGPDGKLVSDGMNDGSYNYFHPQSDPMRHFLYDIHPWLLWGESEKEISFSCRSGFLKLTLTEHHVSDTEPQFSLVINPNPVGDISYCGPNPVSY